MILDEVKIEKRERKEFAPLPENIYQVELLDIESKKDISYNTKSKPKEEQVMETVFSFQFTLLSGKDAEGSLRGRNVWANFVPAYLYEGNKGKNKLYQITEALLGHQLTQEEEAKMDKDFLNGLISKQCRVGIKNKTTAKGQIFSNIETYYSIEMTMTPLTDEEKEKARVKEKKDEKAEAKAEEEYEQMDVVDSSEIPNDSIPF